MPHTRRSAHLPDQPPRLIRCEGSLNGGMPCNALIGARVAGLIIVSHQGMEAVVERVHSIRCSRCGANTSIQPTSPLETSA